MAAPLRIASKGPGRLANPTSLRRLTSYGHAKAQVQPVTRPVTPAVPATNFLLAPQCWDKKDISSTYFEATQVLWIGSEGKPPDDPNKAKLGKTLRALQDRMPTLLQSPLPQELLAPNISLQLFPSTHPHLPTVSGRVAYTAALWTSPIAWNRVPIIGNVKLEILAERVTSEPLTFLPRRAGAIPEQLVVRWCEKRRTSDEGAVSSIARSLRFNRGADPGKAFTGLFIFDFDREGRVLTHTIEQVQEGGDWERGMGAKFVGLTDWLLGGMKNPGDAPIPMFERRRKA